MSAVSIQVNNQCQWPAEGLTRAPYWVFAYQAIYEREQERIFRGKAWHYVALEAEVPEPGSYKSTQIDDTPVIIAHVSAAKGR